MIEFVNFPSLVLSATTGNTTLYFIADSPLVELAANSLIATYADSPGSCKNSLVKVLSFFCSNLTSFSDSLRR
jgi:hypothetical protein